MSLLYSSDAFDDFLLIEENVRAGADFNVNGKRNREFFRDETSAEDESRYDGSAENSSYVNWGYMRNLSRELIKGKTLPLKISIVLMPDEAEKERIFKDTPYSGNLSIHLILRIEYSEGNLSLITGTSTDTFLLDKEFEKIWDDRLIKMVEAMDLDYEAELD